MKMKWMVKKGNCNDFDDDETMNVHVFFILLQTLSFFFSIGDDDDGGGCDLHIVHMFFRH